MCRKPTTHISVLLYNLVPRLFRLPTPGGAREEFSFLAPPWGGEILDPGNEIGSYVASNNKSEKVFTADFLFFIMSLVL